jgi:hypothetical protein
MRNIADVIVEVCRDSHVPMAQEVFGDEGLNAIFNVMEAVKSLYRHVEPERIAGEVIVFQIVGTRTSATPEAPVSFAALANQTIDNLVLELTSDGNAYARSHSAANREELAQRAVVYHYRNGAEEFLAGSQRKSVRRLDSSARSQFSVPTFSNLREALQHYAVENIRESTCHIFRQAWRDVNRLFFKAGAPNAESFMRDSLTQFLRNRIGGDHDVWPEQNVNERNPVDIRVQPKLQNNRLMLIEIKWLGDSARDDGHVTAHHRDPRAQEGVDQLANYLEEQRRSAPSHVIQAYYVIIDGRRRNLEPNATTISIADGLYYESQEIVFSDSHHFERPDFDAPYRMFARPVCTD